MHIRPFYVASHHLKNIAPKIMTQFLTQSSDRRLSSNEAKAERRFCSSRWRSFLSQTFCRRNKIGRKKFLFPEERKSCRSGSRWTRSRRWRPSWCCWSAAPSRFRSRKPKILIFWNVQIGLKCLAGVRAASSNDQVIRFLVQPPMTKRPLDWKIDGASLIQLLGYLMLESKRTKILIRCKKQGEDSL